MGSKKSKSKTVSSTSNDFRTITNTTSTTNVRDIGVTGRHAVELARVLEQGATWQFKSFGENVVTPFIELVEPITEALGNSISDISRGERERDVIEAQAEREVQVERAAGESKAMVVAAEGSQTPGQLLAANAPVLAAAAAAATLMVVVVARK